MIMEIQIIAAFILGYMVRQIRLMYEVNEIKKLLLEHRESVKNVVKKYELKIFELQSELNKLINK